MKKTISILTALVAMILIFQINIVVFASQAPTVSSDDIVLTEAETLIPVKIKNNSGLMGYKITVKYDKAKLQVCSVTKGDVSSKGNFITNFNTDIDTFDIVWNNTDNVTKDGNLFVISAKAKKNASGKTEISLSYSQPDTFDVTYTDVRLECEDISVTFEKNEKTTAAAPTSTTKKIQQNSLVADDSQILDAVNALLRKEGKSSLDEIDDREQFLKELNEALNTITSSDKNNITDFGFLKEAYNNAYQNMFIQEVTDNLDSNTIQKVINASLKKYGTNDIKKLKNEDKKSFVRTMQIELQKSDSDIPNISDEISADDAIDTFEKLKKENEDKSEKTKNSTEKDKKAIGIIASISGVLIILIIFFIVKKIHKSK